MIWGGKMERKFITRKLDSKKYIETVRQLTRMGHELPEINIFFNVTMRPRTKVEQKHSCYRMASQVSGDLNIIENYWRNLARVIYQNERQN